MWAYAAVRIMVATFYALQDTTTPVRTGAAAVILGVVLMKPMGHNGLALATAAASMLNLMLLTIVLNKRFGRLFK